MNADSECPRWAYGVCSCDRECPDDRPADGVVTACDHRCDPTNPTSVAPDAAHFLDCPVWVYFLRGCAV